ncbi:class I SAM-dependent methyltransferase [Moorena sp. SIO4G3]|uniref:class I SAM-dependent methyltransferase n=1 Tax=Moorena sp. SIO4G3 TaxID=2607821 RepID=UPI00142AA258|nr:class I SAM-dependent methyltransferase [Moorena sp. SIO4G3]NEO75444.1 class I SAM-dependent methyltransferase [Moorena sp. SIO4G3]
MTDLGITAGENYNDYVGPAEEYDFMGASQFRLLCTLGLRSKHKLLDFGCGSLRAGRLFLTYLDEGCYYGVDPNRWLIEDAIKFQVGQDLLRIKKPFFSYNDQFSLAEFETHFDFILAQSILTHTGIDLVRLCLQNFARYLKPDGLILATFLEGDYDTEGDSWEYPMCVTFRPSTIRQLAQDVGLVGISIPWFRPRQTWYVFAKDQDRLPTEAMFPYLHGAVLFDSMLGSSKK